MISARDEYDPKQLDTTPTIIIVTQSATCRNKKAKMSHIRGNHKDLMVYHCYIIKVVWLSAQRL